MRPIQYRTQFNHKAFIAELVILIVLDFFYGCGKDSDAVFVNFEKTLTLERCHRSHLGREWHRQGARRLGHSCAKPAQKSAVYCDQLLIPEY
jgi:hypothetical protein